MTDKHFRQVFINMLDKVRIGNSAVQRLLEPEVGGKIRNFDPVSVSHLLHPNPSGPA